MEKPDKECAGLNDHIVKFLTADILKIGAGITGGNAKGQMMLLQQSHGCPDFFINSLTSSAVIGLLEALKADGRDKVPDPQHILTKRLVDEGAIGKG